MAGNGKRGGGGDRVLESRHLIGLFLGVVLLCGVFFTLGYVMGRTQFSVKAENGPGKIPAVNPISPKPANREKDAPEAAKPTPAGGWDDFDKTPKEPAPSAKPAPAPAIPVSSGKTSKSATPPAAAKPAVVKEPTRLQGPPMTKSSIVLQVAATKQQRDALDMADILQKKKFPAFVANSPADKYYHVQVGPYPDLASAETAKHALEQLGFKSIIKR
jgi:septal ring-binding cell division protein DamX